MSAGRGSRPLAAVAAVLGAWAAAAVLTAGSGVWAAGTQVAPKEIVIGTLYAGSGSFANSSMPEYAGLTFWVKTVDASGGVYVKAYGKKIPVVLKSYDDQSSTSTATTLYGQLITSDHVNILVADFGSVLTSVAIPIAAEHHMLLFDQTASGISLFSPKNPYMVDTSIRTSALWPTPLAQFLLSRHVRRVAVVYAANDFDQSQAQTLVRLLAAGGVHPVADTSVPTTTTDYATLLHTLAAQNPQAVIEFGYDNNDIAWFQNLSQSGLKFPLVFTIYPGLETALLLKDAGPVALAYTYTYAAPPLVAYNKVTVGLGVSAFLKEFPKVMPGGTLNFQTIAGYNTGLVIQEALATSPSLDQLALRHAVQALSGHMTTLEGPFQINAAGAQVGEPMYIAQFFPTAHGVRLLPVYPADHAQHAPVYPAP